MLRRRVAFTIVALTALTTHAWGGHTRTSQVHKIIDTWLSAHQKFRVATDTDCDCERDIQQMKTGYGGDEKPIPNYHPYAATGDFNNDGVIDFAIVVIDRSKPTQNFTLLIFNGPFHSKIASPAFVASGLDLRGRGLAFGPPRPRPYRLVMGPFASDNTAILIPRGQKYKLKYD